MIKKNIFFHKYFGIINYSYTFGLSKRQYAIY